MSLPEVHELNEHALMISGGFFLLRPGVWSWSSLRAGILSTGPMTPISGWVRSYLSSQQNPILFNPNRRIFIGYDDPVSICAKARWAKNQGFGGVMVWDLSMDKDRELSSAMTDAWNGIRTVC